MFAMHFMVAYYMIGLLLNVNVLGRGRDVGTKVVACFGESVELKCADGETIEIKEADYELLKKDDTKCNHVNNTSTSCQEKQLRDQVQYKCGGKDKCLLKQDIQDVTKECLPSLYLTVSYQCITKTADSRQADDSLNPTAKFPATVALTTSVTSTSPQDNYEMSVHMRLTILFINLESLVKFILSKPRQAVLCVILSLAFGISLLIVFMLIIACYERFRQKNADSSLDIAQDDTNGVKQILLSQPTSTTTRNGELVQPKTYETVLVTRENGVPLQETTISSDSTLLTRRNRNKHAEVISTIKRTHSIDEGTQTDIDEFDAPVVHQPRTLSIQEAQELGDLVDVMNYYNSRIDDDDAFYPPVSGSFSNNNNNNKLSLNDSRSPSSGLHDSRRKYKKNDKYHYANSGPSFADGGRPSPMATPTVDRQPLISLNNSTPIPPSPYHLRNHNQDYNKRRNLSRNPSELSYTTSASESSLGNYSPDAIFNGENLRHTSISRTPKPGVRGDGYDFIVNSNRPSNR